MTQSEFSKFSPELQATLTAQGIQVIPDAQAQPAASPLIYAPSPVGTNLTAPGFSGWQKPQPAAIPNVLGVLVPLNVPTPDGDLTAYYLFGPEHAPQSALMGLLEALAGAGVPLKTWKPKESGWGNKGQGRHWGR